MCAKIGTVNCNVIASASGSSSTAPKVHTIPINPTMVRVRCAPIRWVRMLASPGLTAIHASTSGTAHAWRKRSEEHTSELQSLMRTSYAVFCLKTKNNKHTNTHQHTTTTTHTTNNTQT